jgi:hypothetical protein
MAKGQGKIDRGAQAELQIAADLINKGLSVFRNLSPVGPVDMLALLPSGRVLKVQATTGCVGSNGKRRSYDRHHSSALWNILAVSFSDGVKYYTRSGSLVKIEQLAKSAPPPCPPPLINFQKAQTSGSAPKPPPVHTAMTDEDISRRRWLIGLSLKNLGPNPSARARRHAVKCAIEEAESERRSDAETDAPSRNGEDMAPIGTFKG